MTRDDRPLRLCCAVVVRAVTVHTPAPAQTRPPEPLADARAGDDRRLRLRVEVLG